MSETTVMVFADIVGLSQAAAEFFAQSAAEAVAARGRFSMALAGGATPRTLYDLLAQAPYSGQLPWAQMHFYWGDERCVPPDHPESNYCQARTALLDRLPVKTSHIHRIRGEWEPAAAAAEYARQLGEDAAPGLAWPRLDLAILGVGADGHTASLFPEATMDIDPDVPAIAVTAHYQGRPADRVTLTPRVFNSARAVVFLVAGASKAVAVAATLEGPHEPQRWPAQRICPDAGEVLWLIDQAAAGKLAGGRYFDSGGSQEGSGG
jgi:6-phosphogluconolactonase